MDPNDTTPPARLRRPSLVEVLSGEPDNPPVPGIRICPAPSRRSEEPAHSEAAILHSLKQLRTSRH
jgi:hypothetical protein